MCVARKNRTIAVGDPLECMVRGGLVPRLTVAVTRNEL